MDLLLAKRILIYDRSLLQRCAVYVHLWKQRLIVFVSLLSQSLLRFFLVLLRRLLLFRGCVLIMIAFLDVFLVFRVVSVLIPIPFLLPVACGRVRLAAI